MIEKIIDYSIRNPFVVITLALVVAGWGVYSMFRTPIDAIPDLSENQVIVFADWPGRSPREVEDQVTYPLSVNLQGLAGVKAIRATSEFGFSMINIIFEDDVGFYFARDRVLERLSIAETFLPEDVKPYLAPDATALGQIFWYTVEGEGYDLGRLRAIQDWFVRYQLYSVPGVAEVASVGGFPIEYQIDVDPAKLRAYGVTLGELYSAVARSNSAVGGRVIQKGRAEYLVRSIGWIESLEDVENIVIKSVDGTPVYVSNVASVQFGSTERRSSLEKDGNEAVGGVVLMRYDENPLEVTKAIKDKIGRIQAGLPEGVRIVPFYDRTRLIEEAVGTVSHTLLEEMLVASLAILFIMRHVRSALIICITLPLSVLISFILMRWLNIPSNIMSLSGIAISIGVLVDASIVMVDQAMHTLHRHFGNNRITGDTRPILLPALKTVGRPIFFSLLIMIISFIPVFALGGMEGRMFHPLAFTKTFALVGVSLLAITLVPAVIPIMIRGRARGEHENWLVRRVIEIYRPVLGFLMDHPWPIIWTTALIFVVGLIPAIGDWKISFPLPELPSAPFLPASGLLGRLLFPLGQVVRLLYVAEVTITAVAIVLAAGMLASVWAAWKDERGFSRLWWLVAAVWGAGLMLLAVLLPPAAVAQGGLAVPFWLLVLAAGVPLVIGASWLLARGGWLGRATMAGSLVLVAFVADRHMERLGREFMPPLNEGTAMDMPVTVPRASITQVADDLKARDALLRGFPEVESVVGKAGRAETPTDPAPPDMIETVINFRPREHWPKRKLLADDALWLTGLVYGAMVERGALEPRDAAGREELVNDVAMSALPQFDEALREIAYERNRVFETRLERQLTRFALEELVKMLRGQGDLRREVTPQELQTLAGELAPRHGRHLAGAATLEDVTRLAEDAARGLTRSGAAAERADLLVLRHNQAMKRLRRIAETIGLETDTFFTRLHRNLLEHRHDLWSKHVRELNWALFDQGIEVYLARSWQELAERAGDEKGAEAQRERSLRQLAEQAGQSVFLWQKEREDLAMMGGDMDMLLQVPGWGNIWTQPIINRVDMLATGVRTMIGVKVYGDDLHEIQRVSEEVAEVLKRVEGAADVFPDQIVGEGYLEIDIDRQKAARYGISVGDIQDVIESALGGKVITTTVEGRERFPVRIRYARAFREDEESVKDLLVSAAASPMPRAAQMTDDAPPGSLAGTTAPQQVPLSLVADVRLVEGPSMIKSENGLLRSYVQLNVRDRDIVGFVEEAQRAVADQVKLPPGMYLEWSGQFEHQMRARRTLSVIIPVVILVIFLLLYVTYHDLADSVIVLGLAVPGAIAGGVLFQWLFGFNFSVAVWVGYIACFGLATESGLVILVYLREAIDRRGGLANMTLAEIRGAVMEGAVHRTRPKLLTEVTTLVGLAPMLWATGTGAEIMSPMAAPVLGGILVSDEIIDLLLPVLFYRVRRRRWQKLQRETRSEETPAREALEPALA